LVFAAPGLATVRRLGSNHLIPGLLVDFGLQCVPRKLAIGTTLVGLRVALDCVKQRRVYPASATDGLETVAPAMVRLDVGVVDLSLRTHTAILWPTRT